MKKSNDAVKEIKRAFLNEKGQEVLDSTPLVLDLIPNKPTLNDRVRRMVAGALSLQAEREGFESFDEANDFEIEDEFDSEVPFTQYNILDMEEENYVPEDIRPKYAVQDNGEEGEGESEDRKVEMDQENDRKEGSDEGDS